MNKRVWQVSAAAAAVLATASVVWNEQFNNLVQHGSLHAPVALDPRIALPAGMDNSKNRALATKVLQEAEKSFTAGSISFTPEFLRLTNQLKEQRLSFSTKFSADGKIEKIEFKPAQKKVEPASKGHGSWEEMINNVRERISPEATPSPGA